MDVTIGSLILIVSGFVSIHLDLLPPAREAIVAIEITKIRRAIC
jgi:hypothetical protein